MSSHIPSPAELLRYLPDHRVLICVSCQYAIQPGALARHLKEIHRVLRSRRRPYMEYVSGLQLDIPERVNKTCVKDFPISSLPVQDGLQCNSCSHLCVSEKRMKRHWTTEHDRQGCAGADWHPVPVQTFFQGNMLHYFTKPVNSLNESDSLLLHHFIKSTSLTLGLNGEAREVWQSKVPQLAYDHEFLMHGLLSCAALHLAHAHATRQKEYTIIASTHQDHAMRLFRAAVANLTRENCDPILVFSYIVVICCFASERQDEELFLVDQNSKDVLPTWLYLLRAGCVALCDVWEDLASGPMKVLAAEWDLPVVPSPDQDTTQLVRSVLSFVSEENNWSEFELKAYNDTAIELANALSHAETLGDSFSTWDALRTWPIRVSDEYMKFLADGHPGALILLAHYCILLKKVEENWYFNRRATRLLATISSRLDDKWHPYIQWPLKVFE
ncbi:hypothetical protein F5884DRAFT_117509 [Xylogone sp. PMI_703]|nr:hypothetical protein F5884DRAFT_117509 [Xylogone sp. PMI_703]